MTLRRRLSGYFRNKRAALLRNFIAQIAEGKDRVRILDVGGRPQYWKQIGLQFLSEHRVTVTILNLYPTELEGVEGNERGVFETVVGDACAMTFPDGYFDIVHSNSVIEHVETWQNMKAFARETRRVGKTYYVQTPNFWFPIDPHYYALPLFHWLPRPVRARLLGKLPLAMMGRAQDVDKEFETVDAARLLDSRQMRFLFPDATMKVERVAGLTKSMIAIRL